MVDLSFNVNRKFVHSYSDDNSDDRDEIENRNQRVIAQSNRAGESVSCSCFMFLAHTVRCTVEKES